MSDAAEVLEGFLRDRLGLEGLVPLHEPLFRGREWDYVKECLDTGWVSSVGSYVDRFEKDLAEVGGTRFAIATVNGTAALHAVLHAIGVGPGDKVVCPALSFVATANAIRYCGADPLFVDIDPRTLGMAPEALEAVLKVGGVKAVVPVHIFGHPADMAAINALADAAGVAVVEDAAEAIGASLDGTPCGALGKAGVLSFNGNKIITTGGGGAILTDDEALAGRLKHLTTTARTGKGWDFDHDEVGFNYRLPNLNAAVGCAQLEDLADSLASKRRLADEYAALFAGVEDCDFLAERPGTRANYWLQAVLLKDRAAREAFLERTNGAGIQTRPCWRLLPDLKPYRSDGAFPVACDVESRLVNIPSGPALMMGAPS